MTEVATPGRNTAAIHVGRLLEVRVDAGYRMSADVQQLFDGIDEEIARLPLSRKIVTVADWRRIRVMSPEASARVGKTMVLLNPWTQRSAALVPPDAPVAVLQFARVVREANFADRKIFDEINALSSFLGDVLTPQESDRLRDFYTPSRLSLSTAARERTGDTGSRERRADVRRFGMAALRREDAAKAALAGGLSRPLGSPTTTVSSGPAVRRDDCHG